MIPRGGNIARIKSPPPSRGRVRVGGRRIRHFIPPHPNPPPPGARENLANREKIKMPTPNRFTLGLIQMRCEAEPAANLAKAIERIQQAADQGAEIICLPELFLSPYFCQKADPANFDLAETIPGPSTERLAQVAKAL